MQSGVLKSDVSPELIAQVGQVEDRLFQLGVSLPGRGLCPEAGGHPTFKALRFTPCIAGL
jgi:hypothetical protein